MKFCKDCKHVSIPGTGIDFARCRHPEAVSYDLVSGDLKSYCSAVRDYGKCGKEGALFEPFDIQFVVKAIHGVMREALR